MSILITGAGLVGCHFARAALQRGATVAFFDASPSEAYIRKIVGEDARVVLHRGDIRDLPALIRAVQEARAEVLVHTVSLIGAKVEAQTYTGLTVNLMGAVHAAEAARLCGVRRLIYISTLGAYDWSRPLTGPVTEEFPLGPGRFYGNSKAAAELIFQAYHQHYGLDLRILRLAGVFGRGIYVAGSALGETIHALVTGALQKRPVTIPRAPLRQSLYVYAKDVGRAIDLACTVDEPRHRVMNIATGEVVRPEEFLGMIARHAPGASLAIKEPPEALPPPPAHGLATARAKEALGFEAEYSVEQGLADYIREVREELGR